MHKLICVFTVVVSVFTWSGRVFGDEAMVGKSDLAPNFVLPDLVGQKHDLADYLKNGPVALWFTNLCGGCQQGLPQIKEVFAAGKANLLIISMLGENRETPAQVAEKHDLQMPILLDPEGEITKQYAGTYIPNTCPLTDFFMISTNGKILLRGHYPGLEAADLKEILKQAELTTNIKDGH